MREFRRWYEAALCTALLQIIYSPFAHTADEESAQFLAETEMVAASVRSNGKTDVYTVNFNNISMLELIRFTSKITNLNFVFDQADLQFSVSFVSEEAVSAKSMMAALGQVLRMHDLVLLEEGNNVLITKNTTVRQIPPIISQDMTDPDAFRAAIVTRVFRIKNANVNAVASIIRSMISVGALVEISAETRQLIVTDLAANVDQIAALLDSLDAPHSPLDVETFVVKNIPPIDLIGLTEKILDPFTEGNPLIFVPQMETNSIYIISTPFLIERAMSVMEDLDIPSKRVVIGNQTLANREIFIYKPQYRSPQELIRELNQVAAQIKTTGGTASPVGIAIEGVQEMKETGSLIFIADPQTATKLKGILDALDTPGAEKTSFYIYKILQAQEPQIAESLKQMEEKLQSSPHPNQDLIDAIKSMKWIKETNSLVFTGTDAALKQLGEVLPTFDVAPEHARTWEQAQIKSTFLVYTPAFRSGEELKKEINDVGSGLKQSGLADPSFLQTLDSVKWVPSTNSLVFTGDPDSIAKIHAMLESMDTPTVYASKSSEVFIYKPQYISADQIQEALKSLIPALKSTHALSDQSLADAIEAMRWNRQTQSFIVTSEAPTIARLKILLSSIDTAQQTITSLPRGFFLYKLQNSECETVLKELKNIAKKMPASSLQNQEVVTTIDKIECIKSNNSLLITGPSDAIEQVKTLISEFDIADKALAPTPSESFWIYKPKYLSAIEVQNTLADLSKELEASGLKDPGLFKVLHTMRHVTNTDSLVLRQPKNLDKVQKMIAGIDTSAALGTIQNIGNITFLLYKVQSAPADKLISSLKTFAIDLKQSNVQTRNSQEALDNVRWIKETNCLLFAGNETLEKVDQLVKKFDLPALSSFDTNHLHAYPCSRQQSQERAASLPYL